MWIDVRSECRGKRPGTRQREPRIQEKVPYRGTGPERHPKGGATENDRGFKRYETSDSVPIGQIPRSGKFLFIEIAVRQSVQMVAVEGAVASFAGTLPR